MIRKNESEILDHNGIPDELVKRAYRDLAKIHCWLGDTKAIVRAIRRDPLPVHRILDVGCATGVVLEEVGRRLGVEVVGADLRPHPKYRRASCDTSGRRAARPAAFRRCRVRHAPKPSSWRTRCGEPDSQRRTILPAIHPSRPGSPSDAFGPFSVLHRASCVPD